MTSDTFKPRRDKFFEHDAQWGEVTVGTIIAQRDSRTNGAWEVIATSTGGQHIKDGQTLFFRVRNITTGQELTLAPRGKLNTCVVLTLDPADTETAPPQPPTDADAVELLMRELGAEFLASRDEITGEITCPDYVWDSHLDKDVPMRLSRGYREHMLFAHQLGAPEDLDYTGLLQLHGQAHDPRWPNIGKGGFPHRHLPEVDIVKDFVVNRRAEGIKIRVPQEAK